MTDSRAPSGPVLRIRDIELQFDGGRIRALNGVSLDIDDGEFAAITGPSGCGKSSLLGLVGMLESATAGEIYYRNESYDKIRDRSGFRRNHIGFVFQSFQLIPTLSTFQNVVVPTIGRAENSQEHSRRANELLARLGLENRRNQYPNQLSGGERQRVAIARALVNNPDIILADEPTGSLDSASASTVLDLLAEIRREKGLTLLMVTHDEKVSSRADRVIHLRDGKVCSPSEVTR